MIKRQWISIPRALHSDSQAPTSPAQVLQVENAPVETPAGRDRQFDLGHGEPATALGCLSAELQLAHDPPSRLRSRNLRAHRGCVRAEVADQGKIGLASWWCSSMGAEPRLVQCPVTEACLEPGCTPTAMNTPRAPSRLYS
jgi:hypothetical protein